MKYGLSENQLQEIREIISSYPEVDKAIIFGSRAIDTFKEASDVDIAIVGEKCDLLLVAKIKDHLEDETYLPFFFDIIAYNSIKSPELKKHIQTKGKILFQREDEWKEVKLGEILEIITKGTTPPKGKGFVKKGINYIKSDAINYNGIIDTTKFVAIDQKTHEKFKRSQLKENDILFSMAGAYLGKCGVVLKDMLPANTNQALAIIRINKERSLPYYIYYFLKQASIIEYVNNISGQSAQPNINFQEISSIKINLPPLPEQKAIAEVLSSLDDKIDLLHRQNKTLEEMAETLFRQWFIEERDESWEEGKLGDILSVIESGKRPKGGIDPSLAEGFPSVGAENINGIGNYKFGSSKYITKEFYYSLDKGIVKDYDVLIYKDGAYIGKKAMFGLGFPFKDFAINEHVFILRSNERSNQFYLYFLLQQDDLASLNTNSAQPGLNQTSMKNLQILLPPKSLVEKFGSTVEPYVIKILKNSCQTRKLENLRDALLPKLMSGEVRIKK